LVFEPVKRKLVAEFSLHGAVLLHPSCPRVKVYKTRLISLAVSAAASSTPEAEQCLLSDQEQKTFAHAEIFSV
jgi:hypothetical protein